MKPLLLLMASALLSAQTFAPSQGQPGDVFLYDKQGRAYLHITASGFIESMPGYWPDQVYRLLLERERDCWQVNATIANETRTIFQVPMPLPGGRK